MQDVCDALWPSLTAGLVLPVEKAFRYRTQELPPNASFAFLHDRVQQAAYGCLGETDLAELHLVLARILTASDARNDHVFEIADHMNAARELFCSDEDRLQLIEANLAAGRQARGAAAYSHAFEYLSLALGILDDKAWRNHYDLAFATHIETAESAYLTAQHDRAEALCNLVLEHGKDLAATNAAYQIRIRSLMSQALPQDAIALSLHALKQVGVALPAKPSKLSVLTGCVGLRLTLSDARLRRLREMPPMTDARTIAAMRLLAELSTASYFASPELYALNAILRVRLSLKHGHCPPSVAAYASLGTIFCGVFGQIEIGYKLGQVALFLQDVLQTRDQTARVAFIFNAFIRHWKEPLRNSLKPLLQGFQAGLEVGDFEFGCHCGYTYGIYGFLAGSELVALEREMQATSTAIASLGQEFALLNNQIFRQAALNLMGRSKDVVRLNGDSFDEETSVPILHKTANYTALFGVYFAKTLLAYIMGQAQNAFAFAQEGVKYLDSVRAFHLSPFFRYVESLVCLAVMPSMSAADRRRASRVVSRNQRKLAGWARHAPSSFQHKWLLVEAERAHMRGDSNTAECYYRDALQSAQREEARIDCAIAYELASRHYWGKNETEIAHLFMRSAIHIYETWGAKAKALALRHEHAERFLFTPQTELSGANQFITTRGPRKKQPVVTTTSGLLDHRVLDLDTMWKAATAIAAELELPALLRSLLGTLMENAGASRGCMLLDQNGVLSIVAHSIAGRRDIEVVEPIAAETCDLIPRTVLTYVLRTRQSVVLEDATQDITFSKDAFFKKNQVRAVACAPLVHKGRFLGAYYLEHGELASVFSADRVRMLDMLSAMIATSLENALLYAKVHTYSKTLEQKVEERTHELKEAYLRIEQLAMSDPLTKLSNRRDMANRLDMEHSRYQRNKNPFCVAIADIDHFKNINDTYGHDCGDLVLTTIADVLKTCLRRQDSVARWGGEEFALLLPETTLHNATLVLERIRAQVEETRAEYRGASIAVTMTFGVAETCHNQSLEETLKAADSALYAGKRSGRNKVVPFPAPGEAATIGSGPSKTC